MIAFVASPGQIDPSIPSFGRQGHDVVYCPVIFSFAAVGAGVTSEHVSIFFSVATNAKQSTQETLYVVDLSEVLLLAAFTCHRVRIAKDPDSVK